MENPFLPEQSLSQINLIPLFSVKVFPCRKKCLNKRKRFPQDRKYKKLTSASQKISFHKLK